MGFHRTLTSGGIFFSFRTLLEVIDDAVLAAEPEQRVAGLPVLAPVGAVVNLVDGSLRPFSMVRRVALGVTAADGLSGSFLWNLEKLRTLMTQSSLSR